MDPEGNRKAKKDQAEQTVNIHGHSVKSSDLVKLGGLLAFFLIVICIVIILWPSLSMLVEGGPSKVVEEIQKMGASGVFMLLALQFLQIVVAFIPGEIVEAAAGIIYGPWLGALILLVGCVFSSACVFVLVRKLGAPFVQAMVSEKYMEKFEKFEQSGKLTLIVFILFLIPAMPKDVFTYLVPLTKMPMKTFLIVANVARTPALVATTYIAAGITGDNVMGGIIVLVIALILCAIAVFYRDKILDKLSSSKEKK
ncbi:MAG: TVP38/TMEM64 family protein [Anaerotardibacter sp.]